MTESAASPDVTVIVAVYNPGRYLEPCIESLLDQSLAKDSYEVIFVDDGSTDASPGRLDEVAAQHDNVIVRHEPNSGWSGRPRNVGIGLARGDYIFFCDHDDWLSPEALDRMVTFARQAGADVLVPKIVSHQRGSPTEIFERNVEDARFDTTALMTGLGPHKMFRRQFLADQGLRFGEGRRFEDQVFVAEAYLLASRIAVLADYPCYHHILRSDEANAAFIPIDPAAYIANITEVIDVLERHTEPGPERDLLLQRPFLLEMLGRFKNRWFVEVPSDHQRALLTAVSGLLNERFPPNYGEQFGVVTRVRAAAIRGADFDSVRALSERAARLNGRVDLVDFGWDGESWRADIVAEVEYDGTPVLVSEVGEGTWQPDPRLLVDGVVSRPDHTDELLSARLTVEVVGRTTAVAWFAPHDVEPSLVGVDGDASARRLVLTGSVRFDPATLAGGVPLDRDVWDVRVRIHAFGDRVTARLRPSSSDVDPGRPAIVGTPGVVATPIFRGHDHHLAFEVRPANRAAIGRSLRDAVTAARISGDQLEIDVALETAASGSLAVHLLLMSGERTVGSLGATLVRSPAGGTVRGGISPSAPADGSGPVAAGRYDLAADARKPVPLGVSVTVGPDGQISDAVIG